MGNLEEILQQKHPYGWLKNLAKTSGHIFVATDSMAQQRTVEIGCPWSEHISIFEDINEITSVIVPGHRQLTDGADIRIVDKIKKENNMKTLSGFFRIG